MHRSIAAVGLVVSVAMLAPALAQTGVAAVAKGPGAAGAAHKINLTATITRIDAATREVTLKGPKGREVTVQAGPEVKNFAQMKIGDRVNVEYTEALLLELKKGSTAPVARTEAMGAGTAKPGERPAGLAGRQITVTAEVVALDSKSQVVTLRGPRRTVDVQVADAEQFKHIAKGDRVEATYSEGLAIVVEPAKK
jgi:Cu/Ag efflux protein CusF